MTTRSTKPNRLEREIIEQVLTPDSLPSGPGSVGSVSSSYSETQTSDTVGLVYNARVRLVSNTTKIVIDWIIITKSYLSGIPDNEVIKSPSQLSTL